MSSNDRDKCRLVADQYEQSVVHSTWMVVMSIGQDTQVRRLLMAEIGKRFLIFGGILIGRSIGLDEDDSLAPAKRAIRHYEQFTQDKREGLNS